MSIGDVNSTARGSGARYNDGKVALDLIPGIALEDCARVFDYGRKKYAAWNWAKGMQWMVVFACLLRHLYAWARGEDNDPESGLPHLGHAMCNLVMLATFSRTYREGDDRPKGLFDVPPAEPVDLRPGAVLREPKEHRRVATPAELAAYRDNGRIYPCDRKARPINTGDTVRIVDPSHDDVLCGFGKGSHAKVASRNHVNQMVLLQGGTDTRWFHGRQLEVIS